MTIDDQLREAVRNGDRDLAKRLLEEGANPFVRGKAESLAAIDSTYPEFNWMTPFDIASGERDLDLLLAMAATKGTGEWSPRFLLSRNGMSNVPDIPTKSERTAKFFISPRAISFEGLEILIMIYGIDHGRTDNVQTMPFGSHLALTDCDIERVCLKGVVDTNFFQILKFSIAVGLIDESRIGILDECFNLTIEAARKFKLEKEIHLNLVEVLRVLLKAGATPSGWYEAHVMELDPYRSTSSKEPLLFLALETRDPEITKLLVAYGADTSKQAELSSYREGQLESRYHVSIQEKAEELGMADLLVPPPELEKADFESLVQELCQEFNRPLKKLVAEHSTVLVVAIMRKTEKVPPVGLLSKLMLDYCPLGFDLWKISSL